MTESTKSGRAFPLSLLFLILTACAVMAAAVAPLVRDVDLLDPPEYLPAMLAGLLAGAFVGSMIGLFQFYRLQGVLWGMGIGGGLGMTVGLIARIPIDRAGALIQAVMIGSAILLITAWLIRPAKHEPDELITASDAAGETPKLPSAPTNAPRDTSVSAATDREPRR
ncbi:hypothetical protein NA78x_004710 [Anatilimnocola sp. NA78]|uniref:hypothetical protein n=1 Tax=Anatilimnocola sp. NA78 TaxID=3415683 RepID=UPI003CE4EE6B